MKGLLEVDVTRDMYLIGLVNVNGDLTDFFYSEVCGVGIQYQSLIIEYIARCRYCRSLIRRSMSEVKSRYF